MPARSPKGKTLFVRAIDGRVTSKLYPKGKVPRMKPVVRTSSRGKLTRLQRIRKTFGNPGEAAGNPNPIAGYIHKRAPSEWFRLVSEFRKFLGRKLERSMLKSGTRLGRLIADSTKKQVRHNDLVKYSHNDPLHLASKVEYMTRYVKAKPRKEWGPRLVRLSEFLGPKLASSAMPKVCRQLILDVLEK